MCIDRVAERCRSRRDRAVVTHLGRSLKGSLHKEPSGPIGTERTSWQPIRGGWNWARREGLAGFDLIAVALIATLVGCLRTAPPGLPHTPARLQRLAGDAALESGRLETARCHYEKALALACESGAGEEEIHALNVLGYISEQRGEHQDAYDHYLRAWNLQQHTSPGKAEIEPLVGLSENARRMGRVQEAHDLAQTAVERLDGEVRTYRAAMAQLQLAEAMLVLGDLPGARERARLAALFFDASVPSQGLARALLLQGTALERLGQARVAVRELSQARQLYHLLNQASGEARCLLYLAVAYGALQQDATALTFCERAVELGIDPRAEDREALGYCRELARRQDRPDLEELLRVDSSQAVEIGVRPAPPTRETRPVE